MLRDKFVEEKRERELKVKRGRIMAVLIKTKTKLIRVKMDSKTVIKVAIFVNSSIKYDDAWACVCALDWSVWTFFEAEYKKNHLRKSEIFLHIVSTDTSYFNPTKAKKTRQTMIKPNQDVVEKVSSTGRDGSKDR